MNLRWYHPIRYEYQRWPLWRLDLDLAYVLKSFDHLRSPATNKDNDHFLAMNQWVEQRNWQTNTKEQPISFSAVGDVMWIRSGWRNAMSPGVKKILSQSDITVANLETPVDPSRKVPKWVYETLHYNAPPEYLDNWLDLSSQAHHVFSICNNHALDQGENGLSATRNSVLNQGANFHCLGGTHENEDIQLLNVKGVKIGFMASTFAINYLTPQQKAPAGIPLHLFGCPNVEPNWLQITNKIKKLKDQGAEFIVFTPHWGYEYEYWPDAIQRNHALKLIELGVDLILGHSPHVLQPVEWVSINEMDNTCPLQVERPGGKGFGVIAWSLGNFLTIMPTLVCKTGVILQFDLVKKNQKIQINNLRLKPVYTTHPEGGAWLDRQVKCLDELPTLLQTQILRHTQQISPLIIKGDH